MSVLYITEFASLSQDSSAGSGVLIPKCPPLVSQTVAISGSSTQSLAFSKDTKFIIVATDSICAVEIGTTNPTAITATGTKGSHRMPASGTPEVYGVNPGDKLAVISTT